MALFIQGAAQSASQQRKKTRRTERMRVNENLNKTQPTHAHKNRDIQTHVHRHTDPPIHTHRPTHSQTKTTPSMEGPCESTQETKAIK